MSQYQNHPDNQRWMTIKQFCQAYQISRSAAYRQRASGLRFTKIGASTRIAVADAEAWAAALTGEAAQ